MVRQEEDLKNNVKKSEDVAEVTAFAAQRRQRVIQPMRIDDKDKSVMCKHCHRSGHSSDSCYAVIGYPEWWGERPRSRTMQPRGRGAPVLGGGGRGRGGVSYTNAGVSYANVVNVPGTQNMERANYVVSDRDRDRVSGISDTQWKAIMSLLNAGKSNESEKLSGKSSIPGWIMDTGASHHLTGRFDILMDVRDIAPVVIVLADGREKISEKEGTVRLGSNLLLKSVFYVEDFHSDLIHCD